MGKLKDSWKGLWAKFKGEPKGKQTKAFVRVLQFFAVMLVLTIFAKGAAGVTMPRVTATTTYQAEISTSVTATGQVIAQGNVEIEIPAGLTVSRINAQVGTTVKVGDTLIEFDEQDLADQIVLARADLRELQLQLRELQSSDGVDDTMLEMAQETYDKAEKDLNDSRQLGASLGGELDFAWKQHEAAVAAREADPENEDLRVAENTAWERVTELNDAVLEQAAITELAQKALNDAKKALDKAQEDYEKLLEKQEIADERNQIAITKKKMDIADQQEVVALLEAAANNAGKLEATVAGTVQQVGVKAGDTTKEGDVLVISTSEEGFMIEIPVTQADAAKLQVGGSVYVKRTSMWGSSEASITAKYYSNEASSMMVRAMLPGNDWTPGEMLEASVVLSRQNHYTCVPISAVHSDSSGSFVYILEERSTVLGTQLVAVRETVTIIDQDSTNVSVDSYNLYGALIMTGSSKPVSEGDRVRLEETVNGV